MSGKLKRLADPSRFVRRRKLLGFKRIADIASFLRVSPNTISRIERGQGVRELTIGRYVNRIRHEENRVLEVARRIEAEGLTSWYRYDGEVSRG